MTIRRRIVAVLGVWLALGVAPPAFSASLDSVANYSASDSPQIAPDHNTDAPAAARATFTPAATETVLIEVLAIVGAFLYGTVTVLIVRTVAQDRRKQLADDVLAFS